MKNIILIGMPCAGKSTVGVLLAKTVLFNFIDTDLIIQRQYGNSLCEIIELNGIDGFLRIESAAIRSLEYKNCVISTGGSAVYSDDAMVYLCKCGTVVYLSVPVHELELRMGDIKTRGVVTKGGTTVAELYRERVPLYKKYADLTVECANKTPERCVEAIVSAVRANII
jgi:Shikimate kinase